MLTWMRNQLNWDAFVDGVRIQREGGYAGIDGFLYLLYYFCAELSIGLTEFNERKRKCNVQLAAIGSRATLPSRTALVVFLAPSNLIGFESLEMNSY